MNKNRNVEKTFRKRVPYEIDLKKEFDMLKTDSMGILQSKLFNKAKKSNEFKSTINSFIKNLKERNVENNVFMEDMLHGTDLSQLDFLEQIFINSNVPLCDNDSCFDNILKEVLGHMIITIKDFKVQDEKEAYIDLTNTIFRMYKLRIAFKCLRRYFLVKKQIDLYKVIDKRLEEMFFRLGDILNAFQSDNNF